MKFKTCAVYAKAKSKHFKYTSKCDLPEKQWPRIKCIWCQYEDPLERDLSYHMLENHRKELWTDILKIQYKPTRRNYRFLYESDQIETALNKAVDIAKNRSGVFKE